VLKLAIKLTIVAIVANATWRVGSAYARHYRFIDSVQQVTQFRASKPDEEIHDRVFELASQYDIPVTDDNLTVTRRNQHTIVDGTYTQPLDLIPGFRVRWPFTVHVDVFATPGAAPPNTPR
jgi:hypothetical protein